MRNFNVVVFANAIECFEVEKLSRVDYTALKDGGETMLYKVSVSQLRGKVKFGRDRAANFCHYHAKNVASEYCFVLLS